MEPTKLAKRIASKKEIILKRTLIVGAAIAGGLIALAVVTAVKPEAEVYILTDDITDETTESDN